MASEADALLTTALNEKIQQAVRNEVKTLRDEINQLREKDEENDNKREVQAANLKDYEARLRELKETVKVFRAEFDVAAETQAQKDKESSKKIQELHAQSIKVADSVSNIKGEIAQLDGLLSEHLLESEEMRKSLEALQVQIGALEKSSNKTNKVSPESTALRVEVDDLKAQVASFPSQLSDVLSKVRSMEADVNTLRDSHEGESIGIPRLVFPSTNDTIVAVQGSTAPAMGATQQSSSDTRATTPSYTIQATVHSVTPLERRAKKNAILSTPHEADHAQPYPASVEFSPSKSPSPHSVSSDGTRMPDTPGRLVMAARRKKAAQGVKLKKALLLPAGARTESGKEINERISEDIIEEQMVEEMQPEEHETDGLVDRNRNGASEILTDDKPITRLEKDLYRQDWHSAGKPGKLDDFVRLQRTSGSSSEGVRNPRNSMALNHADVLLPKPKAKRMPKQKRPLNEGSSEGDTVEDLSNKDNKWPKVAIESTKNGDALLERFQQPVKQKRTIKSAKK